jgi:hypothetical protein
MTFDEHLSVGVKLELTVANWLLVTDGKPCRSLAEAQTEVQLATFDAAKWRGKNDSHFKETRTLNGASAFWHMQKKQSACDLLFYLRDVPLTSVLSRMLLGTARHAPETRMAETQLQAQVFKKGYVKVEVKSHQHAHYDQSRARFVEFPAEYESAGKPSGLEVTNADICVCALRDYCEEEPCPGGFIMPTCAQRRQRREATHPNDPRDNYGYYVLPMSVMKHLMAEAREKRERITSNQRNKAKNAAVLLTDMKEHTMLREATAKQYAELLRTQ